MPTFQLGRQGDAAAACPRRCSLRRSAAAFLGRHQHEQQLASRFVNFVKTLINIERLQKRNMPYALVSSASELRARLQRRRARSCVQRTCGVQGHVDVSLPTHPSFLHR